MTLQKISDAEFLGSIGVTPYDPEAFKESENDRIRTLILRGVAVLQFAAIIGALVWTSR